MGYLRLVHLTFWGSNVPTASIEFGNVLTLVRGPSDTGKSFVVDAIDYMLGAGSLKEIPERDGYSTVLLGICLPSGETVTLTRGVNGGVFNLYRGDFREDPPGVPDETLAAKHNATNETNLSMFLLKHLALDGKQIRKNRDGVTHSLSFRNLAHLCIVDETKMQSEVPPAFSGQHTEKTKEASTLRLLLEDEDDSALVVANNSQDLSRLTGAKIEVFEQLLTEVHARLSEVPEEAELRDQLARLNITIETQGETVDLLLRDRSAVAQQAATLDAKTGELRSEESEVAAIQGRFGLLLQQYDSDLARLATLREVGVLLGFFTPGRCPFCGAEVEDQHFNHEQPADTTAFRASVDAESVKTASLRSDLLMTLEELASRREEVVLQEREIASRLAGAQKTLAELDQQITTPNAEVRELVALRSEVEKSLGLYAQAAHLTHLRTQIVDQADSDSAVVTSSINLSVIREFSEQLVARLGAWGYPNADKVYYDRSQQDIQAGDQYRSAHGKGVRAILHAAFTVGLAQYCFDRDIPHPGFVVLDSPLVTYRPPDDPATEVLDSDLPAGIIAAFYRDLQTDFDGQVIVMENLDPTEPLADDSVDIVFTKSERHGRYGFFPSVGSTT